MTEHSDVLLQEIDGLEEDVGRFRSGQLPLEEFRPRRTLYGVYGQRQQDRYMVRVRIAQGRLTPGQLLALAETADTLAQGFVHITTRQDVEYHFVLLDDVPSLLRTLAGVGLTSREAGGNVVRNVTCDPFAGVCPDAVFDVTPHADAVARHFLRNPVSQGLPRKVKIAFSGCPCDHALTWVHDIGAQAAVAEGRRGFRLLVGGGLGPLPRAAAVLEDFVPEEELIPVCEAVVRVFQHTGDRQRRQKARLKFVLERLGRDGLRDLVRGERELIPRGAGGHPPWPALEERPPAASGGRLRQPPQAAGYPLWREVCARPQQQAGFAVVLVALPAGKITASQLHALADVARSFGVRVRATIEQDIALRWVREEQLPALHAALAEHDLARPTAGTPLDPVACPGAQTCASAITNSKALARALAYHLERGSYLDDAAARSIRVKISGCPNGCGQHPVADLGLCGGALHVEGRLLPVYHLLVNTDGFAELVGRVPARRTPEAVGCLVDGYRSRRLAEESFRTFAHRVGVGMLRRLLADYLRPPTAEEDVEAYFDWEAGKPFSLDERGEGECAV